LKYLDVILNMGFVEIYKPLKTQNLLCHFGGPLEMQITCSLGLLVITTSCEYNQVLYLVNLGQIPIVQGL
jgi:hypothetical protein